MKKYIAILIVVVMLMSCNNELRVEDKRDEDNDYLTVESNLGKDSGMNEVKDDNDIKIIDEEVRGTTGSNTLNKGYINSDEANIYYWKGGTLNIGISGAFYSSNLDGTDERKLLDSAPAFINIVDDYLFFIEQKLPSFSDTGSGNIYKMKKDGSQLELVIDSESSHLVIVNDWMYFIDYSNDSKAVRTKLDGTCYEVISGSRTLELYSTSQLVYYYSANEEDSFSMYTYSIDSGVETAVDINGWRFVVEDEHIYYLDKENSYLYRTDQFLNNTEQITNYPVYYYFVSSDGLYVQGMQGTDGSSKLKYYDDKLEVSEIIYEDASLNGDRIVSVTRDFYFIWNYGGDGWFMIQVSKSDLKIVN